jgi:hypothetical protein
MTDKREIDTGWIAGEPGTGGIQHGDGGGGNSLKRIDPG